MESSTTSEPSFAFVRRRRQARVRHSVEFCPDDSADSSIHTWMNLEHRGQFISNHGIEIVSKRREANARERLRVRNLNSGFAKLRRILPTVPPNRKPSKVDTLQEAIDYIYQLEKILEATGGIPNIAKSFGANSHTHSRRSVTERPFFDDLFSEASPTVRYVPPFNGCGHPCSDTHRSPDNTINPVHHPLNTQRYTGITYLQVPLPDYARSRHSPSSGHLSPTSSLTSEESACGDANAVIPVERFPYPRSPPPLHSYCSATSTYISVSEDRKHDLTTESTWAVVGHNSSVSWQQSEENLSQKAGKEQRKWDVTRGVVNQTNHFTITERKRNQPVLPPVSFLYGNNVTVDA